MCAVSITRCIDACWNKSNVHWQRAIVAIARDPRRTRRLFDYDCTLCECYIFIIKDCAILGKSKLTYHLS